jgi:hypothetical protein
MAQQEVGGRVNSVDSRGDVTYPTPSISTQRSVNTPPRGDVTRDNVMVTI